MNEITLGPRKNPITLEILGKPHAIVLKEMSIKALLEWESSRRKADQQCVEAALKDSLTVEQLVEKRLELTAIPLGTVLCHSGFDRAGLGCVDWDELLEDIEFSVRQDLFRRQTELNRLEDVTGEALGLLARVKAPTETAPSITSGADSGPLTSVASLESTISSTPS